MNMNKKKLLGSSVIFVTGFAAFFLVAIVLIMLVMIFMGGRDHLTLEFLTQTPSEGMTAGGIFPAIFGTALLVILMSLVGVPIGTITAIYLTEYSRQNSIFTRMIQFAISTLAGIPAIVFGLFGLGFFIQFVGHGMDKVVSGEGVIRWGQPNLLWASLTMALLTLPVVIVSVEEALRTVPRDLREASLALGATKFQTIWKIVLPNAMTGVLTGAILAVGRGAGEVAPILFTGVAYFLPDLPQSLSDQFMQLGYHLYVMSTQSTDVEATKGIQYASAFVLLAMTFSMNLVAVLFRYKIRNKHG
ncbi:MAG: phosphate ABC transporter permease PstA [Chlorobiales bacterium]|jgi:phosphate transport system permease protein|nr:phosphate ABC transporter permease PstA [Chlorobiales bacterium]